MSRKLRENVEWKFHEKVDENFIKSWTKISWKFVEILYQKFYVLISFKKISRKFCSCFATSLVVGYISLFGISETVSVANEILKNQINFEKMLFVFRNIPSCGVYQLVSYIRNRICWLRNSWDFLKISKNFEKMWFLFRNTPRCGVYKFVWYIRNRLYLISPFPDSQRIENPVSQRISGPIPRG